MLFWIIGGIGVVAFVLLFVIIFRHWKEIRLLDPGSIQDEQVRKKQKQILENRFERVKTSTIHPIRSVFLKIILVIKKTFHAGYIKLIRIDRLYKQAKSPFANMGPSDEDRMKALLDEARSLTRNEKWGDAERRFLEVLTIDQRSADAYKGLAGLYLKQKMYSQAKETYEFLRKGGNADDVVFAGLAEIAENEGNEKRAEEMLNKALEMRPKLAHRHAELASFLLRKKRPAEAWGSIEEAVKLEPGSVRFLEQSLEIAIQNEDVAHAQKKYDALRFLQKDRKALQIWKDRLEALKR
ncbi:MAG: hypothetical protein NUV81_02330 [bacterium]|nr:hypothetical protein [bacterium]